MLFITFVHKIWDIQKRIMLDIQFGRGTAYICAKYISALYGIGLIVVQQGMKLEQHITFVHKDWRCDIQEMANTISLVSGVMFTYVKFTNVLFGIIIGVVIEKKITVRYITFVHKDWRCDIQEIV